MNHDEIVERIETELDRMDALDNGDGGIIVLTEDLPDGWVTLADEYVRCSGLATEILKVLEGVNDGKDLVVKYNDAGDHMGYILVWGALDHFPTDPPEE